MNTIGFTIKYASSGVQSPILLNADGRWERGVVDLRDVLRANIQPDVLTSGHNIFMMSFDRDGCYLTVARAVQGRQDDFAAGWLYIPASVSISDSEIGNILQHVIAALKDSDLTPHIAGLEELFSRSYPSLPYRAEYRPSNRNGSAAGRDVSNYSAAHLMGTARYQPYYSDYSRVFIVENFAACCTPDVINISGRPLVEICSLVPPTQAEVERYFGPDVHLALSDGTPFTAPIGVEKGASVSLRAVRPGFADLRFNTVAERDGDGVHVPTAPRWLRHVGPENIRVIDAATGRPVPKATISVNDAILGTLGYDIPESQNEILVVVRAPGYRTFNGTLEATRLPADIRLVAMYGDKDDDRLRSHRRDNNGKMRGILIGACGVLVAGAMVWGGFALFGGDDKPSTEVASASTQPMVDPNISQTDQTGGTGGTTAGETDVTGDTDGIVNDEAHNHDAAVRYLKGRMYDRAEMEKYADLHGMWDDLNNLNFDALKPGGKWEKILKEAGKESIVDDSRRISENKKLTGKAPRRYNKAGDTVIGITKYANNLSNFRMGKGTEWPSEAKESAGSGNTSTVNSKGTGEVSEKSSTKVVEKTEENKNITYE